MAVYASAGKVDVMVLRRFGGVAGQTILSEVMGKEGDVPIVGILVAADTGRWIMIFRREFFHGHRHEGVPFKS